MDKKNISTLKGVGDKTLKLLNKINIYTIEDLLTYCPRDYNIFNTAKSFNEIDNEKIFAVLCKFKNIPVTVAKKNLKVTSAVIVDNNNDSVQSIWYNMPYLSKTININENYILRGQIYRDRLGNIKKMIQPEIFTIEKYNEMINSLQPVYSLTKGLTNNQITKFVKQAFEQADDEMFFDYLPEDIRNEKKLISEFDAYKKMHFPKNHQDAIDARNRLAFDEFILFVLALRKLKGNHEAIKSKFVINMNDKTNEFIESLPYKMTNAQLRVIDEITKDMSGGYVMNRLIQGDVGSGKTIVAIIALMNVVFSGYQGAIMAPTEVLANQHYANFVGILGKYGIRIALLTGHISSKEKKITYEKIKNGDIDIIIGTHALIVDKVEYKNLALVITDEQHRFGVMQRKFLAEKGDNPHILVMSATPIPRTLAIILYGDLKVSVIDEMPNNRKPIKNCVVTTSFRDKAYKFIDEQVQMGHQVYIICPLVEENENIEACDVISYAKELDNLLGNRMIIRYLHGKQKAKEKNEIMEDFAANKIQVLVSTTVIEVGINVPNATVMMVENAERFGLAALHQLRGRVGRGDAQSYCIFISSSKDEKKLERLELLNKSNDGFFLAKEDLRLRGPGDLFGIRQSGDMVFKVGDIYADSEILKEANETADKILANELQMSEKEKNILNDRLYKYIRNVFDDINL